MNTCCFSKCSASMMAKHLLLYSQHGLRTLAVLESVLKARCPYTFCFGKCSDSQVSVLFLFCQVCRQPGVRQKAVSASVLPAKWQNTCCLGKCSCHTLAVSASVLSARCPYTCCFGECPASQVSWPGTAKRLLGIIFVFSELMTKSFLRKLIMEG